MELKGTFGGFSTASVFWDIRTRTNPLPERATAEELLGKRVRIRAVKALGSAHLLDGLTGTVVALHPIASGWVKLELDENVRTPHRCWSVATDRLVLTVPETSRGS